MAGPGENSDPSLSLTPSLASLLPLSSPTSSGCCIHLLTVHTAATPDFILAFKVPWFPACALSQLLGDWFLHCLPPMLCFFTSGPLFGLSSHKLVCVIYCANQKPTFSVKGQRQSLPLSRCLPMAPTSLHIRLQLSPLDDSAVESHRAYHSQVIASCWREESWWYWQRGDGDSCPLPHPGQCLQKVLRMSGEMVATSSSASGGGFGEVRMAEEGNNGGWDGGPPEVVTAEEGREYHTTSCLSLRNFVFRPPDQHQGGRGPSRGRRRELCLNKVLQRLQTVILQG